MSISGGTRSGPRRRSVDWRLCFVADTEAAGDRELAPIVLAAVEAGATLVQLRAKNLNTTDFTTLGKSLASLLEPRRIPFLINDRVDMALACRAAGVHLGREDMPYCEARKLLGRKRLIGLSVTSVDEAVRAEAEGADYLGAGPIFPTATKKTDLPPLGIEGLEAVRSRVRIPILAIGGISVVNAGSVMAAGADGLAVISAILSASDPARAASELRAVVDSARPGR